jgi:hypothetical protein
MWQQGAETLRSKAEICYLLLACLLFLSEEPRTHSLPPCAQAMRGLSSVIWGQAKYFYLAEAMLRLWGGGRLFIAPTPRFPPSLQCLLLLSYTTLTTSVFGKQSRNEFRFPDCEQFQCMAPPFYVLFLWYLQSLHEVMIIFLYYLVLPPFLQKYSCDINPLHMLIP